jgi:hypothetical protein
MKEASTDDLPSGKFSVHGRVSLTVKDNIIIYHAKGPFNIEFLAALEKIEENVLRDMKSEVKDWCEIIIFEVTCMAYEEVVIGFGAYLKELKKNGLIPLAIAYVIGPDVEGDTIMKSKFEKCHADADINFSIFSNEDEARSWVDKYLPASN